MSYGLGGSSQMFQVLLQVDAPLKFQKQVKINHLHPIIIS